MFDAFKIDLKCYDCSALLAHKFLLPTPKYLDSINVKYYTVHQKKNEAIILWPGVIHFGVNMGVCIAEAVNFAPPSWLDRWEEYEKREICSCNRFLTL